MTKKIAVKLIGVEKRYQLKKESGLFSNKNSKNQKYYFDALKKINLTVNKGERIGIVGKNGCGKTTLLKVIAGITEPSAGSVYISGKIVSIIDLQAGFHDDLTGIDNIHINGILIGMDKQEIENKLDSIVKFANIEEFIDEPLYKYSQGMKLKLGFSIAIHSDPDVLVLDETMSVGDEDFHKQAFKELKKLSLKNKTIIASNHWRPFLKQFCNRIIYLEKGKISRDGNIGMLDNELII